MQAEELLRQGRIVESLDALQAKIRSDPANAKDRVFLFQLLCLTGDWNRAMTQLNVAAEMDSSALLMAQVCRAALNCEALRAEIFEGKRSPLVFGEPQDWIGWLIQANQLGAQGHHQAARELRDRAMEAAPAVTGTLDDRRFEWVADADARLGPVLEAIVDGRYYWVPFQNIREMKAEAPADLRDLVWLPAQFTWANGGASVGLIPTRYPGSEASGDSAIRMARKTDWQERADGVFVGLGQRMLATDQGEYPLLEIRHIALDTSAPATPGGADG